MMPDAVLHISQPVASGLQLRANLAQHGKGQQRQKRHALAVIRYRHQAIDQHLLVSKSSVVSQNILP